jgi:hypothetical protein
VTRTTPARPATALPASPHPQAQRRILTVLVISQILSGAGLAAGITVGALLAQDMLGSTGLAGVPSALFTGGSALAAGYLTGALGSAGIIAAAVAGNAALQFLALFVYGAVARAGEQPAHPASCISA